MVVGGTVELIIQVGNANHCAGEVIPEVYVAAVDGIGAECRDENEGTDAACLNDLLEALRTHNGLLEPELFNTVAQIFSALSNAFAKATKGVVAIEVLQGGTVNKTDVSLKSGLTTGAQLRHKGVDYGISPVAHLASDGLDPLASRLGNARIVA